MLDDFYTRGYSDIEYKARVEVTMSNVLLGYYWLNVVEYIGSGAHREVFDLNNGWVMKFAEDADDNYQEIDVYEYLGDEYLARVVYDQGGLNAGVMFMEYVEPIENTIWVEESDELYRASRTFHRDQVTTLHDEDVLLLDDYFSEEIGTTRGSFIEFMKFLWKVGMNDAHEGNIGIREDRFVMLDYNYGVEW